MTETLKIVLDTLIPGDEGDWQAAGSLGLTDRTRALLADAPEADAVAALLSALPQNFPAASPEAREAALARAEAERPAAFEALLVAAYNAYYTDGRVRDVIARLTGYPNRPPQPEGYDLPPFDERLLDPVRARAPFWREVPS